MSSVEHSPVLYSAVENVAEATTLKVLIICLFFLFVLLVKSICRYIALNQRQTSNPTHYGQHPFISTLNSSRHTGALHKQSQVRLDHCGGLNK